MNQDKKRMKICALSIALIAVFLLSGVSSVAAYDTWIANRPPQTTSYNSETVSQTTQNGKADVSVLAQMMNYTENDPAYGGNDVLRLSLAAAGNGREALKYYPQYGTGYAPAVWDTFMHPIWNDYTPTQTGIVDDDSGTWIDLTGGFWFYGIQYWRVWISSNGFISFTDNSTSPIPKPLNSTAKPNTLIAPFWTDLNVGSDGQISYYMDYLYGSYVPQWGNWLLCVTWKVHDKTYGNAWQEFQLILKQNTGSINYGYMDDIYINYKSINVHPGVTIGVENQIATKATTWDVNGIASQSYLQMLCIERGRNLASLSVRLDKGQGDSTSAFFIPTTPNGYMTVMSQNLNQLPPHQDYNWGAALFTFAVVELADMVIDYAVGSAFDAGTAWVTGPSGYEGFWDAFGVAQFVASTQGMELPSIPSVADLIPWDAFWYTDPGGLSGFGDRNTQTATMSSSWQLTDNTCRYDSMILAAIDWVFYDPNTIAHSANIVVDLTYYTGVGTQTETVSTSIHLTMKDTIAPTVSSPPDINYVYGQQGNVISWTATDNNPSTYEIWRQRQNTYPIRYEEEFLTSGPWQSGQTITCGVDGFQVVSFVYWIKFFDTGGNCGTDYVTVTVSADTTPPSIDSPSDVTYAVGATGNRITWHPRDLVPLRYEIWKDGVNQGSWTWNGGDITYPVDGLGVGTYGFVCKVFDYSGNTNSDEVTVTTLGPPTIQFTSPPGDTTIAGPVSYTFHVSATDSVYGSSGITSVEMYYSDLNGPGYVPVLYPATHGSGSDWYRTFSIYPDTTFEIGAKATNVIGQSSWATAIYVHVVAPPTFTYTQPSITVETGQSFTLRWTATGSGPTTYVITRGGTQVASGSWSAGVDITYTASLGPLGTYTYAITIYTSYGYSASSSTTVTVVYDASPPVFTSVPPTKYTNIGSPVTLSWTATDKTPSTYTIMRGGVQMGSGSWSSGVPITCSWTPQSAGTFYITCTVYDQYGHSSSATVKVVVRNYM